MERTSVVSPHATHFEVGFQATMVGLTEQQSLVDLGDDTASLKSAIRLGGDLVYSRDLATDEIRWIVDESARIGTESPHQFGTGSAFQARVTPDDAPTRSLAFETHMRTNDAYDCTFKFRRPDGGCEWLREFGFVEYDGGHDPVRFVGILRNVTDQTSRYMQLERIAYFDPLTGHLNRARLAEDLSEAIAESMAQRIRCGFLIINVDNLAMLNDAHGFAVADDVIRGVARRVERQLRPRDLLGRIGGNQFGIVLKACDSGSMVGVAESILSAIRVSIFQTNAGPLAITVSLGGVIVPDWADCVTNAFGHAEEALSQAKQAGRDCFVEYRMSADRLAERQHCMATGDKVVAALKERRLKLAFQPIVSVETGEPVMYECLLRMLGDNGQVVPAGQFMSVAERLGLVRMVDRRSMEMAIEELHGWPELRLTVNISGLTATDSSSLANLLALLKANANVVDRLTLEITETVAMQDIRESAWFISNFRDLGCGVALDDFGAGYTSFRHLKNLAVDMVKIDGQFVQNVASDTDNQLFVKTLLDLAQGFGLKTVAECVEVEADAEAVKERGVDYLQGYLCGRPSLDRLWRTADVPVQTTRTVA